MRTLDSNHEATLANDHNRVEPDRTSTRHHPGKALMKMWGAGKLSARLTRQLESLASGLDVVRVAVMPDVHEGAAVPNGCVMATRELIYPDAVGKDIGCGVSAIQFAISARDAPRSSLEALLRGLHATVPTLKHTKAKAARELPDGCAAHALSDAHLVKHALRDGILQLGTLGRGNHFVELQRDSAGMLWGMVHSGSRGMGDCITRWHLEIASRSSRLGRSRNGLLALDLSTDSGQSYYRDMEWAIRYATESRMRILNGVADLVEHVLGVDAIADTYIDCPHNFARLEEHFGERCIVHRKSANSARDGEVGIVLGSMASGSRIVTGRGHADALCSSAHGAGRVMSRREAAERISTKALSVGMRGIVYQEDRIRELCDEAPSAYKNLSEVMRAQSDLVRTENTLSTLLNYKGL